MTVQRIKVPRRDWKATEDNIIRQSRFDITVLEDGGLELTIEGPASHIPGLKNSKIPKTNYLNPNTTMRLRVITRMYFEHLNRTGRTPIQFGDKKLWMVVILSPRCNRLDEDNAYASIKDWLEPPSSARRKHIRKWGVGMVDDDKKVNGFAIHSKDLCNEFDTTSVIIQLWDTRRECVIKHVADQRAGTTIEHPQCRLDL